MSERRAGALLVLTAAVLWGTTGTVQELALPTTAPIVVAALRSLLGGIALAGFLVLGGRGSLLGVPFRDSRAALLVAVGSMLVFQVGYLEGIRRAGIAVGTLTAIGSAPLWAGLLAGVRGRRPTARWAAATGIALVGLVLLLAEDVGAATTTVGIVAALLAGAAYATFATATADLVARGTDRVALVAAVFLACGIVLAPAVPLVGTGPQVAATGLVAGIGWLGFGTIAVAYVVFATGLRSVDAPAATTLTLAEPLTAAFLAVVVAGERLASRAAVGAGVLLLGLLLSPSRAADGA